MEPIVITKVDTNAPDKFIEDLLRNMLAAASLRETVAMKAYVDAALSEKNPARREKFVEEAYRMWIEEGLSADVVTIHNSFRDRGGDTFWIRANEPKPQSQPGKPRNQTPPPAETEKESEESGQSFGDHVRNGWKFLTTLDDRLGIAPKTKSEKK